MKIHGHEIPAEFVREAEDFVLNLSAGIERDDLRSAIDGTQWPHHFSKYEGLGFYARCDLFDAFTRAVFAGLKKSGKIEYLGRSLGWRVKR